MSKLNVTTMTVDVNSIRFADGNIVGANSIESRTITNVGQHQPIYFIDAREYPREKIVTKPTLSKNGFGWLLKVPAWTAIVNSWDQGIWLLGAVYRATNAREASAQ